jgi:hypothetical protein
MQIAAPHYHEELLAAHHHPKDRRRSSLAIAPLEYPCASRVGKRRNGRRKDTHYG